MELSDNEESVSYDKRVDFRTSIQMHPAKVIRGGNRFEGVKPQRQLQHKRVRALIHEERKVRAAVDIAYPRRAAAEFP